MGALSCGMRPSNSQQMVFLVTRGVLTGHNPPFEITACSGISLPVVAVFLLRHFRGANFSAWVVAGTYCTEAMEDWIQPGRRGAEELPRPIQCPVSGVYPQRVCSMRVGGMPEKEEPVC